jgi:ribonucleotide monophosphatase NagD (HAD superfamily)
MIGDLLDRDILLATQAGLKTFYFPGNFLPAWDKRTEIPSSPDFSP